MNNTVTIPAGGNSSTSHNYEIRLTQDLVAFYIDRLLVFSTSSQVPDPYTAYGCYAAISNAATVTTTNMSISSIMCANQDILDSVCYQTNPSKMQVTATSNHENDVFYSATALDLAPANNGTDILTIQGSATKTIKLTKLIVSGTTTGATTQFDVILLRRSTGNTGGSATTISPAVYDTQYAAASAVVKSYTTNPTTLGTLVGTITAQNLTLVKSNAVMQLIPVNLFLRITASDGIVLRGVNDYLCVNLNSTTTAGLLNITAEWTEA